MKTNKIRDKKLKIIDSTLKYDYQTSDKTFKIQQRGMLLYFYENEILIDIISFNDLCIILKDNKKLKGIY